MRISELYFFFSLPTSAGIFFTDALVCKDFTRCLKCFLRYRQ
uniref:Uncharacterized protein n=1 Tax=Arundo donax TaxID=35708 RepID=A0A0A9FLD8_ARUDO